MGELAQVEASDALVAVRQVVVRGAVMIALDLEERIVEAGEIAGQEQRCDARLVGLQRHGQDVGHQASVLAQIFGQAVLRAVPW